MPSPNELPNTFGVFVVLEILAAPFGYEGATAFMNRQWAKALVAYAVALPLALAGLVVLGVPILGRDLTASVGSSLSASLRPIAANPYVWLLLWLLLLFWLGGSGFVERMRIGLARAALSSPGDTASPEPPPTRLPIDKAALKWVADTLNAIPESLPAQRKTDPAPATANLTEEQRRHLMILYSLDVPKNLVWLKFLPHTPSRDLDSLILILYGYRALAGKTEVPIPWLSRALIESRCLPELNTVRIWQIAAGNESGRLDVDEVARSGRPYMTLLNLSRGGEYQLSEAGIAKGRDLANELIEKA